VKNFVVVALLHKIKHFLKLEESLYFVEFVDCRQIGKEYNVLELQKIRGNVPKK